MKDIATHLDTINKRIEQLSFPQQPENLYDPIRYTLRQEGKRIRPLLVLLAYEFYKDDSDSVLDPALSVELFHNFTLIHDDIMDRAPLRRGQPTVVRKWNQNIAILSGDQLMAESYKLLEKVQDDVFRQVFAKFNQIVTQVCEGQQLDMDFETQTEVSVNNYLTMIERKTSVLLGYALWLGATLAGSPPADANRLYECGKNLGIAFQLRDDYLDLYGNSQEFGKRIGGDILSGKKTYLVVKTLELANNADKELLIRVLLDRNIPSEERIHHARSLFEKYEVHEFIQDKINDFMSLGLLWFDKISVEPSRRRYFLELMESLGIRNT